jgi:metal-responsive CopG/Arc/MetJ family transcriptional regulator
MTDGYKSVNVPKDMYDEISKIVKQNPSHYSSISEFVKDALRTLMREYPTKKKTR